MMHIFTKYFLFLFLIWSGISDSQEINEINEIIEINEALDQLGQVESKVNYLKIQDENSEEINSEVLNEALNLFENLYENHIYDKSSYFVTICNAYFKTSEKTLNFLEGFLDLVNNFYDSKSPKSTDILNTIGLVYYEENNLVRSEKYFKSSLKLYGLKELKKAPILNKLGRIKNTNGDYKEALDYFEKAHEIYKKFKLEKEDAFIQVINNLGVVSGNLGLNVNALKYYTMVLDWSQDKFGEDDIELPNILNNIAMIYMDMEEYAESLEIFEKVLEIKKKQHGKGLDKNLANIYYNLGMLHFHLGDKEESQDYFEKALKIYDYNYGEGHLLSADVLSNLGLMLSQNGDIKGALKYLNKALNIMDSKLGVGHFKSWSVLGNIGSVYRDLELNEKAIDMYHKQMDIYRHNYESKGSPPSINPCNPLYNLGVLNLKLGQFNEALRHLENCLKIREEFHNGELDSFGKLIADDLEFLYEELGEWEKAKNVKNLQISKNIKSEF